jgi:uncharacterized DUF497 family protein
LRFSIRGAALRLGRRSGTINLAQHGVSLEKAWGSVFFDPVLRLEDARTSGGQRDAVTGLTEGWALLLGVHVLLEDDGIRIISARPATAQERRVDEGCQ